MNKWQNGGRQESYKKKLYSINVIADYIVLNLDFFM